MKLMVAKNLVPSLFVGLILLLLASAGIRPLQADNDPQWQPPLKIYDTTNEIDWPLLLSDTSGRLHLIWNEQELEYGAPTGESSIYYMTKNGDFWSDPIDVVVPGNTYLDGVVDQYGRLHIVMSSLGRPVYFTQTQQANALAAPFWSPIESLSGPLQTAASIAIDPSGVMHVVYGGSGSIVHISSADWGETWSEPVQIGSSFPSEQAVTGGSISLAVDEQGTLNTTWTLGELPDGYPPTRSEFAYSMDGGQNWSEPIEIAPPDFELVALEAGDGRLHTLDIGRAGVGGRYHRWSLDNGDTWSSRFELSRPEEGTGLSGGDLALDNDNILHAVFGLDTESNPGETENDTMAQSDTIVVHSYWDGQTWAPWINISGQLPAHLERISIDITHGNRLHAIWASYGLRTGLSNSIWYAEGQTGASAVAVDSLPLIPTPQSIAATAVSTPAPTPTPTPLNLELDTAESQSLVDLPALALLVGVLSSTLIIGFVFVWQMKTARK